MAGSSLITCLGQIARYWTHASKKELNAITTERYTSNNKNAAWEFIHKKKLAAKLNHLKTTKKTSPNEIPKRKEFEFNLYSCLEVLYLAYVLL